MNLAKRAEFLPFLFPIPKNLCNFRWTKTIHLRALPFLLIALLASSCSRPTSTNNGKAALPASTDFQKGELLINQDAKKDSAFYYFAKVTESSKDSLLIAMSYSYMATIQEDAADYFGSQESALQGLRHVDEKDSRYFYCLSSIYNALGQSSSGLKNYDAAIEYYQLAIKFQPDEKYRDVFRNNIAVAYREKKEYSKAIQILQSIIEKQKERKSGYARMLNNLASLKWMRDPGFNPLPELMEALQIRIKEHNDFGITSSYNHIAEYYLASKPDSALFYSRKMYEVARKTNSADDKIDALRKLIALVPISELRSYLKVYETLSDSIIVARNTAKNQFALIKYQSDKNKADNLELQRENSQKKLQILRQRIWMYGIGIAAIIGVLALIWWYRKKRKKIKWEMQAAIRDEQLKTSQKVHDIVANGLYRIMNEIEYKGEIEKEDLLDKIDQLYERSRDISYESPLNGSGSGERISEMITSFASPEVSVSLVGNERKIWEHLPKESAAELEQVIQELMINMSKHSYAKHVVIRFDLSENKLAVLYRDDGIGFSNGFRFGNGLRSTETRIQSIGGQLIFAKEPINGVSIKIVIPIRKT